MVKLHLRANGLRPWAFVLAGFCLVSAAMSPSAGAECRPGPGRPDFSGVWKLDLRSSDLAGEPAPESKVQKVEQKGDDLLVTIDEVQAGRPIHGSASYALDGRETVNEVFGNPLKSTIVWEDGVMVMRTWGSFGGAEILLVDRWSIAPDGRTLRIARHFEGRGRTSDQKLIFDRQ